MALAVAKQIIYLALQPRSGRGASDTHVDGIVTGLRQLGYDVKLVALGTTTGSLVLRLLAGLWLQIRYLPRLRRADVVYVRMHPTAALLPLLTGRTPYVVEVNGVPEDYVAIHPALRRVRPLVRGGIRRLLKRAAHVVVVTDGLGRRVREWAPGAATTVVPNAADPQVWRADLPRPQDAPAGDFVVFFGALTPWQGVELASLAAGAQAWPPGVPLLFVGEGPDVGRVRDARREAPSRILYVEPLPPEELACYVAHARASLCLKRYHDAVAGQSPLKLYESVMAGTAVIATPLHGATDVPDLRSHIITCRPDPESVARAVTALVDGDVVVGAVTEQLRREHSWSARAEVVAGLLEGAAATSPPRRASRRRGRPERTTTTDR